ncbi:hypothetical protein GCM10023063_07210 [Arthrobacter methylotrophus]
MYLLHDLAIAEDPPQNDAAMQEIVQDHRRITVRPAKFHRGCFAALTVEGTNNGKMHADSLDANHSHSQKPAISSSFRSGRTVSPLH